MKRYKINVGMRVNKLASKDGIKWRFRGKYDTNEWKENADRILRCTECIGVRVTDCETQEVIYEAYK